MPLSRLASRLLRWGLRVGTLGAVALAGVNVWIVQRARSRTYSEAAQIPAAEVGIVLGTSPRIGNWSNAFFENRMNAAAELYRQGKVKRLLVSGDNGRRGYDEPTEMMAALARRGVPESAITRDFAGFRTLDTMARAHKVFGIQQATVITDDFHQPRSLFLADHFGVKAVAFRSEPVAWRWSTKTRVREILSRAWSCVDVYLLRTQPKFYGEPQPLTTGS